MIARLSAWLKRMFTPCKHDFKFVLTLHEQNLRAGYEHKSHIYVCCKCFKREVREDFTL